MARPDPKPKKPYKQIFQKASIHFLQTWLNLTPEIRITLRRGSIMKEFLPGSSRKEYSQEQPETHSEDLSVYSILIDS